MRGKPLLPMLAIVFAWSWALALPAGAQTDVECIGVNDSTTLDAKLLKQKLKGPVGNAKQIAVAATAIPATGIEMPPGIALKYAARLTADADDGHFCCWSALWIAPDGSELKAVSDNGKWMVAPLTQKPDGTLDDLRATIGDMRCDGQGKLVSDKERREQDAPESMGRLADGSWLVGFECGEKCDGEERASRRAHRIRLYPAGKEAEGQGLAGAPLVPKPVPVDLQFQPPDRGPEGLTVLDGDRVVVFSENYYYRPPNSQCGATKAWVSRKAWGEIERPTEWEDMRYPLQRFASQAADGKGGETCYEIAGIARLPIGTDAFVILERRFERDDVMHVRLALTNLAELRAGIEPKTIFSRSEGKGLPQPRLLLDNFEGIATAPIPGGAAIWLLSDDNADADWQKPCAAGSAAEPVGCQRTLLLRLDYLPDADARRQGGGADALAPQPSRD
ncbi:esterase-like activity of phytase family protein [Desertibaculum subflavum]|uniref:esterase-like activity of phytase family protein n=1 Tax=Desertibaculum subflavum TaxID=2268458 RepID=UPI0013C42A89